MNAGSRKMVHLQELATLSELGNTELAGPVRLATKKRKEESESILSEHGARR